MKDTEALKRLEELISAGKDLLTYFRPEMDSLKKVKYDIMNLEQERRRLDLLNDAARVESERLRAAALAEVESVKQGAARTVDAANRKILEAERSREEAKALLEEVKKFCNSVESKEYKELAAKLKAA